jgi:two-component system NtrC family sensor kinase
MSFGASHTGYGMHIERAFVLGLILVLGAVCLGTYTFWHLHRNVMAPLVGVIAVGVIAWTLAHYALFSPIRQLVAMARAIRIGDFSKRLGFERRDEIGSLAFEMDTMCDQLEAARRAAEAHLVALEQLRHSDRIATLGRLASSVAHELGNPLNVIELRAQLILSGDVLSPQQTQLSEQAQRMTQIINQVLSFARMQPAQLTRLDLLDVVRKAISLTEHTAKQHRTSVQLEAHSSRIELLGDPDKLLQVIVNLVVNAIQASPEGAVVHVRTSEAMRASDQDPEGPRRHHVCIEVQDEGTGIAKHLLTKIFEPFFSGRTAEGGTGLGLSVAQGIAREHEGSIVASSEPAEGACFHVYLPQGRIRSEETLHASQAALYR